MLFLMESLRANGKFWSTSRKSMAGVLQVGFNYFVDAAFSVFTKLEKGHWEGVELASRKKLLEQCK